MKDQVAAEATKAWSRELIIAASLKTDFVYDGLKRL